jgi:hypothetical protein
MLVALLDDHTVVARAAGTKAHDVPKLAATTRVGSEISRPPATSRPELVPADPHHPLMTMRHPTLALERQPGLQPAVPEGNGTEVQLGNPRWVANASPDQVFAARLARVAANDERAHRELQPDGAGTKSDHDTFHIRYAPDGSARITDKRNLRVETVFPAIAGRFDVTDALMRRQGIDPYASYKMKVLDATRDERVEIGSRYRTQQLARSRELMQNNLTALWARPLDAAARKEALFELWDDCAETGSEELVIAGRAARSQLVGFLRSKLPPGSADAFTADEVARLNARRKSRESFAPY